MKISTAILSVLLGAVAFFVLNTNVVSIVTFAWQTGVNKLLSPNDNREERLLAQVLSEATAGNPISVLNAIDSFAWKREFLMNVGDGKGLILDAAIQNITDGPKWALEIGTYCGYSAVRIGRLLPEGGKLISIEISPKNAELARQIINHAGLSDKVQVIVGTLTGLTADLRDLLGEQGSLGFVFLDHHKNLYVTDLQLLREGGFLHPGTVVVADNILVPGAPAYKAYMLQHPELYRTVFYPSKVEYQTLLNDEVAVSIVVDSQAEASADQVAAE